MCRLSLLLSAIVLSFVATSRASTDGGNAPFAVVYNGKVVPVQRASDMPRKSSGQTLYLCSAVSVSRCTAKPSPSATPAPKPKSTPPFQKKETRPIGPKATPPLSQSYAPITVSKPSGKIHSKGKAGTPGDDPGDDYGKPTTTIPDPIQPVNRGTFWFNHQLYHYVFIPLNKAYKSLFPQPVRTGISNVFLNAEYPTRFVNDLLQWKPGRAGLETEKFLINTTVGVGGIFKVSDKISWLADVPQTDTSATLAKWGIPPGCYVVWPVLGPKSLRDTVGFAGDIALDPVTWLTYGAVGGAAGAASVAVSAPETTTKTSDKLDTYETLTRTSIDRYSAVRSAYEQNRKKVESR